MGLDMYFYKKTYVKNWDHFKAKDRVQISIQGGRGANIKPERISYIVEEVAYWRKFNALHGWFVENCGGGVDKCQEINVSNKDLEDLLEILNKVKSVIEVAKVVKKVEVDWNNNEYEVEVYDCEDMINDLFPPTKGFFFGSTEIDSYFKDDVFGTIDILTNLLNENKSHDSTFYYQASW